LANDFLNEGLEEKKQASRHKAGAKICQNRLNNPQILFKDKWPVDSQQPGLHPKGKATYSDPDDDQADHGLPMDILPAQLDLNVVGRLYMRHSRTLY
jgi:hypothetical protein